MSISPDGILADVAAPSTQDSVWQDVPTGKYWVVFAFKVDDNSHNNGGYYIEWDGNSKLFTSVDENMEIRNAQFYRYTSKETHILQKIEQAGSQALGELTYPGDRWFVFYNIPETADPGSAKGPTSLGAGSAPVPAGKYWVVKTYKQDDKSVSDGSLSIEWDGNLFTDGGDINFSEAVFTITQNSEFIQEKTVLGTEFAGELTLNTKQTWVVFFNTRSSEAVPTGSYSVVQMYNQNNKNQLVDGLFDIQWDANKLKLTNGGGINISYASFTITENNEYIKEKAALNAQIAGELTFAEPPPSYVSQKWIVFFNAKDSAPVGVGPPGETDKALGVLLGGGGMRSTGALGAVSTNDGDGISDQTIDIIVFAVAILLAFILVGGGALFFALF